MACEILGACRKLRRLLLPVAVLAGVMISAVDAETIHLKGGKSIQGEIIPTENDETVVIKLRTGGTIIVTPENIVRIETGTTPGEQLREQEKKLRGGNASQLYRLAEWCMANSLHVDGNRLLLQTLEVDPNHAGARKQLGWTRHEGAWFQEDDYRHFIDEVHHDGAWVPTTTWVADLKTRFTDEQRDAALELLKTVVKHGRSGMKEAASFRALDKELQRYTLRRAVTSRKARERQFAAREFGVLADRSQASLLSQVAILDGSRGVRNEALKTLRSWGDPDAALAFLPYLSASNQEYRVHATEALSVFPDRRSVGPMIDTYQAVWAGFGRVHFAQIVQRSYVQDYELVSGGTGNIAQEVADPVISTFVEGVVLDIDITRVLSESGRRASALQRASGRSFASDVGAWESWWASNKGKKHLASKDSEDQKRN